MQKYINAVSKNKITHFVQANNKRTLCNLNVTKGNWEFSSANSIHPKCRSCEKIGDNFKDNDLEIPRNAYNANT